MDIGSGIAAGAAASTAIISTAVVIVKSMAAKNGNGNGNNHCSDHSGICAKQDGFDEWLSKIEAKLDRVIERREHMR